MAINSVLQSPDVVTITNTSITLGYLPGNTYPPRTLFIYPAATATITLPPISAFLPSFTTTQTNFEPGAQNISITIYSLSGQIVNVSGAGTASGGQPDLLVGTVIISSTNADATFVANPQTNSWYKL